MRKALLTLFCLGWLALAASPTGMEGLVGSGLPKPDVPEAPGFFKPLISFYQRNISPVDGDRCPMHPSCSAFAKEALSTRGPVVGTLLGADRFLRCGFDLNRYQSVHREGRELYLDPVPPRERKP